MSASRVDRSTAPPAGPLRPYRFPEIEAFELQSGLPVLFARSAGSSVATLVLVLDAGGTHEEEARAGLATLTGSLLESGAGERSAAEIADDLERLGVQLEVGTSWDASHVEVTGLSSRMAPATDILSDLVRRPSFPEDEVERIRQEQLAGILQRRAEPRGLANEMATRFIYAERAPFSRPLGGTTATVQGLTRSDALEFHRTRYVPAGGGLIVSGDLEPGEARDLAERGFSDWAGAPAPAPGVLTDPRFAGVRLVIVDRPGSVQSEVRVGHVGLSRSSEDYFPLIVMNAILGGAFSSRLNLNLRERHGFTYGVTSSFVMRRARGPFLVSTAVQTEVTAPAVAEIMKEIRGIRETEVTPAELEDARRYLAGTFPLRLQTTEGIASRLAELLVYRLPLDYFEDYRERIVGVTADEVLRVAREHLRPDETVVVVVGDAATIRAPLEELALGPVRVVDAEGGE